MASILRATVFVILVGSAMAQPLTRQQIQSLTTKHFVQSVDALGDFLRHPNNGQFPEHSAFHVGYLNAKFLALGFETQVLLSDGVPHLFAEYEVNPSRKTLLVYLQIDGQPVDSSQWEQESPYIPVMKVREGNEWKTIPWNASADNEVRIFARSASDSKGPAMAFIEALRILKDRRIPYANNLKVIMDFQEEMGSPTLPALVASRPDLFQADAMLIMDGTRHVSNLPTLTYGARGIATATLVVYGANDNLHSGQYGNYAPNPVFSMARLLATLKDEQGRVLIPGYYEGVETVKDQRGDEPVLNKRLGIKNSEQVGDTYLESLQYPSLNVRGLQAGWVGKERRTIIPSHAIAEIDMRLVPASNGERLLSLLQDHIRNQGYYLIDREPTEDERAEYQDIASFTFSVGSRPFQTRKDGPFGEWLRSALSYLYDSDYVEMPTTGGSQPIAPFVEALQLPAVSVRIPNPDNSIHAPNENIRVGNYRQGIETSISLLIHPF